MPENGAAPFLNPNGLKSEIRMSPESKFEVAGDGGHQKDSRINAGKWIFVSASWQILLQKSLMVVANRDSVALIRFAAESGDDGAAQSRPRSVVLLVLS
jgi:hypothetical protein